ncbi:hypothetical protein VRM69_000184 [Enterobacter hormaechei]|uniref:hypothetical protein n=1 Tax=Enterobacter hormaechei TaxID=158836 RepID=UPI0007953962|nr:hypothetical protein [Enterobacter hormaechei]EMB2678003.1 hypothetical protein [Enterobacter hormaechei subsp. hoffmannii]EKU5015586.1 hypothetical protein [Enterobacter hormaechei]EMD5661969.1 hypothetical protein [Enterobacter hormaechei]MBJ6475578.1 hypothetical protein [Enterobacter hormaechei]MBJ6549230.1 hypothetical protein [Enterobacter hormaechei]
MKLTLKEMNGLLNGKCLPSDLIFGETLAEYLVRKFAELDLKLAESQREFRAADATIENMQMQVEKLAAENSGLIEQAEEVYAAGYNHGHLNTVDGIAYADCVKDDFYGLAVELMREAETPATDAFLVEVRAEGVEMFATWNDKHIKNGVEHKESLTAVSHAARWFAELLRKGVQS